MKNTYPQARLEFVKQLRSRGISFSDIGQRLGISRQRAFQILYPKWKLKKYNVQKVRNLVFIRDQHRCQWTFICKNSVNSLIFRKRKKMLIIHHIDGDESNNEIKNLITLCRRCHGSFHGYHREIERPFDTIRPSSHTIPMKSKTVKQHMKSIAPAGGKSTLKKHGREHFKKLANLRWRKRKQYAPGASDQY